MFGGITPLSFPTPFPEVDAMTSRRFSGAVLSVLALLLPAPAQTQTLSTTSPDGKINVLMDAREKITLAVTRGQDTLCTVFALPPGIREHPSVTKRPGLLRTHVDSIHDVIRPVVPEKRSVIPDIYRQRTFWFEGGYALILRVYDDGVAYRFRTEFPGEITVTSEDLEIRFSPEDSVWFPEEESFLSHSERLYALLRISSIADTQMCCLPAVVTKKSGARIAVTESDLLDYPGLYLRGTGKGEPVLRSLLPAYPEQEKLEDDRTVQVTARASYLARTRGTRTFPWRVLAIALRDGDLISNDIVYRLGSPNTLTETGWIKPGKVAWDWWNANNVYDVPFVSGVNTETYQHYIDFAATYGLEYVIFDEGWSKPADVFAINPDMDMEGLFAHARKNNVGIILWVTWIALDARMEEALDLFAAWGAAGIKVDFMQRDDQKMVNYYEKVAREAARRRLLVDFHGSYKPTGLSRTYPNVLTREGVRGLEWNKWSADITPNHNVTLPFTRMVAGAMDYTPGAMRNAARGNFQPIFNEPMSQGTRCHQLAMYVVYESPLQMLCDRPTNYLREPGVMEFLRPVPTTWDTTFVLEGKIGDHVTVARRNGTTWYIGAMTGWAPRSARVDLSFLQDGAYTMISFEDGVNAARSGNDYVRRESQVKARDQLSVRLAPGGGWAAILRSAGR
jgi:alpha-glucosidase